MIIYFIISIQIETIDPEGNYSVTAGRAENIAIYKTKFKKKL